jgi:hypothetical protein
MRNSWLRIAGIVPYVVATGRACEIDELRADAARALDGR